MSGRQKRRKPAAPSFSGCVTGWRRSMRLRGFDARVAVLIAGWAAPATTLTGVELFDLCFRKGTDGQLACTSYVRGFADAGAFEGLMMGAMPNIAHRRVLRERKYASLLRSISRIIPTNWAKRQGLWSASRCTRHFHARGYTDRPRHRTAASACQRQPRSFRLGVDAPVVGRRRTDAESDVAQLLARPQRACG